MKFRVSVRRRQVCVLGRVFSLGWQPLAPSDGVIIILVVVSPNTTILIMGEMSNTYIKYMAPDGEGHNPVTSRTNLNKGTNISVMECYYLSNPMDKNNKQVRGFRQSMYLIWNER